MRLPLLAIKNYQFVLIAVLLSVFLGVRSFNNMPRAEDPFLDIPKYTVVVVYPGASPGDMEDQIVSPIEDVIDEVDHINEVRTEITTGLAVLKIEGEYGANYDDIYDDILKEITSIRNRLPEGIVELEITQFKPEDRIVVQQYAFTSETAPYHILTDYAEDLEDKIEKLKSVKKVDINANPQEEIRVSLDFQKISNLGISLRQVITTLKGNNANIPGGSVKSGQLDFNIKSSGNYNNIEDIRNIAVMSDQTQVVYLKNIADVNYRNEDLRWIARHNGEKCVFLNVKQKKNSNILQLAKEIAAVTEAFKETLPTGIHLEKAFDQSPSVELRLNDFLSNLIQGILLVGIIIIIFLGWRPALVIVVVIPLSILIAITLLDYSGYALQQISIAALVIALGLLVDNGIVVIENIVRFKREGHPLIDAAAKGTGEVGYAIISSTITTILAFAPLALLNSGPGNYLRSLPLTVIFVLSASLLLALTVTPIMASRLLKSKKKEKKRIVVKKIEHFIENIYQPILNFSLRKGWIIILAGIGLLAASITLFPSIGVSFFPTADKPLLLISVNHPYSSNIEHTDKSLRFIESILDTTEYVKNYTTNTGHGNPQIYYNRVPKQYKPYHGEVVVNFKGWDPTKFYKTLHALREKFQAYPDGKITFRELKNGAPFEAPIEILLLGDQLDTLKHISYDIEKFIKDTEGVLDVNNPLAIAKTDIRININKDKAALFNVSLLDIDRTIRAGLNGLYIDKVNIDEDNEEYPLILRLPVTEKTSLDDVNKIYITNAQGKNIPLTQLASIEFEQDYAQINHFNTDRNTAITANVINPDKTKEYTKKIITKLESYKWPKGYTYYIGGEYETQTKSFGDLGILLITSLILIFAVLVLQFRSISQPLVIFSAIPLAISGSFIALYLTGWSFSFFAFVGFISLIGIVINNSIILVDYTNQLIKEGTTKMEAIKMASKRRFTPIVLTSLTTILGLMPLTFSGTQLWSPLGWTLIGGMVSSTFLMLLVVPVLLNWMTRTKKTINK